MSDDNTVNENKPAAKADTQIENGISFKDLALSSEVQTAIENIGYETPSPIQAQAIPHLLAGRDILGVAQTGTGKTAAFALPLLSTINVKAKKPQVLVLAPTRELAIQVAEAFASYAKVHKGFKVLPIYGGQAYSSQLRQLERGVQVVVGTPGRVMDHIRRKTLDLSDLKAMVLDEADEMLRMGFIDDVEWILEHTPSEHQTALFSATMPSQIKRIATKYLNDPAEVTIKVKTTTAETIRQRYLHAKGFEKMDVLTRILEAETFDGVIVFVRTKNATVEVVEKLQARGYAAEALSGDVAQNQREKTVNQLKKGNIDILVATDVAARGLDVERIGHVINYDIPYDTESYVHRIGRTGRAGREGEAILFVAPREKNMLGQIERATKKKIEPYEFPTLEAMNERKVTTLLDTVTTELSKDLSEYKKLMAELLEKSELTEQQLLLAFASLSQSSKPFYVKELQLSKSRDRRDRNDKNDRNERSSRRKDRSFDDLDLESYRLEVGHMHGVDKGNIVGAIANEANISSKNMGKIYVHEDHSFIDLPKGMPKDILSSLKKVRVCGQPLNISQTDDVDTNEPRRPRRDDKRGGRDGNRGKGRGDKDGNRKGGNGERSRRRSNDGDRDGNRDNAGPKARKPRRSRD